MRAFLAAVATAIVLAALAAFALDQFQRGADVAYTTGGARLEAPRSLTQ